MGPHLGLRRARIGAGGAWSKGVAMAPAMMKPMHNPKNRQQTAVMHSPVNFREEALTLAAAYARMEWVAGGGHRRRLLAHRRRLRAN